MLEIRKINATPRVRSAALQRRVIRLAAREVNRGKMKNAASYANLNYTYALFTHLDL